MCYAFLLHFCTHLQTRPHFPIGIQDATGRPIIVLFFGVSFLWLFAVCVFRHVQDTKKSINKCTRWVSLFSGSSFKFSKLFEIYSGSERRYKTLQKQTLSWRYNLRMCFLHLKTKSFICFQALDRPISDPYFSWTWQIAFKRRNTCPEILYFLIFTEWHSNKLFYETIQ